MGGHYHRNTHPDSLSAHIAAGVANSQLGQYDKALKYFKKGYQIDANNHAVCWELARNYYMGFQDAENAILFANKAIEIDANDGDAFLLLGRIYYDLKKYKSAKQNVLKAKAIFEHKGNARGLQSTQKLLERL